MEPKKLLPKRKKKEGGGREKAQIVEELTVDEWKERRTEREDEEGKKTCREREREAERVQTAWWCDE